MKTSKEMQLKIIDKMRENVINGSDICNDIEYWSENHKVWCPGTNINNSVLTINKFRVKPTTITINGVDIPKPLEYEDIASDPERTYYVVSCCGINYVMTTGISCIDQGYHFVYNTKQEAVSASRKLFGMTKQ